MATGGDKAVGLRSGGGGDGVTTELSPWRSGGGSGDGVTTKLEPLGGGSGDGATHQDKKPWVAAVTMV